MDVLAQSKGQRRPRILAHRERGGLPEQLVPHRFVHGLDREVVS